MSNLAVVRTLRQQVELLHGSRDGLRGRRLEYFREAFEMASFQRVVDWAKTTIGADLFSTIEQIESMERSLEGGNRTEIIVQCCLILELAFHTAVLPRQFMELDPLWLFEGNRTLEEIAYLCYRLRFVRSAAYLCHCIHHGLFYTVSVFVRDSLATWQGMLLIFKAVAPRWARKLLVSFSDIIERAAADVPPPAATLFLSFVSDALCHSESQARPRMERALSRLLELGASPMISTDCHSTLFRVLSRRHIPAEGCPWWLEDTGQSAVRRGPTALSRILSLRLSPEFLEVLGRHVCCNLDAVTPCQRYFPTKLPRLACLAARQVNESELETLGPVDRFITSKHVPLQRE